PDADVGHRGQAVEVRFQLLDLDALPLGGQLVERGPALAVGGHPLPLVGADGAHVRARLVLHAAGAADPERHRTDPFVRSMPSPCGTARVLSTDFRVGPYLRPSIHPPPSGPRDSASRGKRRRARVPRLGACPTHLRTPMPRSPTRRAPRGARSAACGNGSAWTSTGSVSPPDGTPTGATSCSVVRSWSSPRSRSSWAGAWGCSRRRERTSRSG